MKDQHEENSYSVISFSTTLPEDSAMPSSPPPDTDKSFNMKNAVSPGKVDTPGPRMRRSSESDIGTPPKGT